MDNTVHFLELLRDELRAAGAKVAYRRVGASNSIPHLQVKIAFSRPIFIILTFTKLYLCRRRNIQTAIYSLSLDDPKCDPNKIVEMFKEFVNTHKKFEVYFDKVGKV